MKKDKHISPDKKAKAKTCEPWEQRYSIFSNYRWGTKVYQDMIGKGYHLTDLAVILLGVVSPFAAMAFPSTALWLIQSGYRAEIIFAGILSFVVAMKLLSVLKESVQNRQEMDYFFGRVESAKLLRWHSITMDYEVMESPKGRAKEQAASHCIYSGDELGIESFLKHFPMFVQSVIGFLLYSFLVGQINPWVILYMVASALLLAWLDMKMARQQEEAMTGMDNLYQRENQAFAETMNREARGDMILYQAKEWLLLKLHKIGLEYKEYFKKYGRIYFISDASMAVLNFIRDSVVYVILIRLVMRGELSVQGLLLFVGAVAGYSVWLKGLLNAVKEIVLQNHYLTDYRNYLAMGKLDEIEGPEAFLKIRGQAHEICLEDVCYRYAGASEDTISHVNLTIRPGEKIALVGANGAGKTTLVKLITGLYRPTSGHIYLDGVDVTAIPKSQYFKEFAAVFQDSQVFACTVAQNVSCQNNAKEEQVKECLVKAGLWEKIEALPQGIHHMLTRYLSDEGVELSGGEVQKLMLARALYKKAPVLILDEPTAALDPIAESRMYEAYGGLGAGKTNIFISHRLSSTRFCDRICFLREGQITETGTHEELLKEGGGYAEMFEIQAHYYEETSREAEREADYETQVERILGNT